MQMGEASKFDLIDPKLVTTIISANNQILLNLSRHFFFLQTKCIQYAIEFEFDIYQSFKCFAMQSPHATEL